MTQPFIALSRSAKLCNLDISESRAFGCHKAVEFMPSKVTYEQLSSLLLMGNKKSLFSPTPYLHSSILSSGDVCHTMLIHKPKGKKKTHSPLFLLILLSHLDCLGVGF